MAVKSNDHACECLECSERYLLLKNLHNWLVCYSIATPEDMAQSFPGYEELVRRALNI